MELKQLRIMLIKQDLLVNFHLLQSLDQLSYLKVLLNFSNPIHIQLIKSIEARTVTLEWFAENPF